ncbi:DUF2306 domain-containing protein [Bhargavaea ullalensis]|uniref:Uncharacterized membrane protein HdeD (DUF308 family) n=1 Tax=Bhargavaea ullalensis TaxID=1265685 RepID=A0ABV2GE99_9BACL
MFNMFLVVHILSGIVCLITGLFALQAPKRRGRHTSAGTVYHASYLCVFITALVMSVVNWADSAYLFYIALFSYGNALLGLISARRKKKGWMGPHIGGVLGSYIGIVTAVLVVNVPRIPVINEWPVLLFWILPTVIGTPLIVIAGRKYRPRRRAV